MTVKRQQRADSGDAGLQVIMPLDERHIVYGPGCRSVSASTELRDPFDGFDYLA